MTDPCARCGAVTPTIDNVRESTFWGSVTTSVTTTVERTMRIRATYWRQDPRAGAPMLRTDDERPLCSDCWGRLVGRFMQGRSVDALPGKEGR